MSHFSDHPVGLPPGIAGSSPAGQPGSEQLYNGTTLTTNHTGGNTTHVEEVQEEEKRSPWTELEIRGPIKNLSPELWKLTHLTALFLNDNNLQRIPADIARLSNLLHLDLSGNKLRSLPAEMGDMLQLRDLRLNNNSLRVLPYELGRLFQLQNLVVTGNPLQPEILSMVSDINGTAKLLSYLLDNLTVCPRPPEREWIQIAPPRSRQMTFSVMSYNVLCDKYATRQQYGYCPSWALAWDYRKTIIMKELLDLTPDIIALQEVETEQYYAFFQPELAAQGYEGIFSPKSRARTMDQHDRKYVDGCAIFFHKSKFTLLEDYLIEFNQLAMAHAEGSDAMLNRVMLRDNIGIAALLEVKDSNAMHMPSQHVLVANAHIHWDPEYADVKLIQTLMLTNELNTIIMKAQSERGIGFKTPIPGMPGVPVIMCSDLNSLPDSSVVEYLRTGRIATSHRDLQGHGYDGFLQRFSASVRGGIRAPSGKPELVHQFNLRRTYSGQMDYTNFTYDFKGVIDYIFYSADFLMPLGLMGPVSMEWAREWKVTGCPNPHFPSDHFPLLCQFELLPQH